MKQNVFTGCCKVFKTKMKSPFLLLKEGIVSASKDVYWHQDRFLQLSAGLKLDQLYICISSVAKDCKREHTLLPMPCCQVPIGSWLSAVLTEWWTISTTVLLNIFNVPFLCFCLMLLELIHHVGFWPEISPISAFLSIQHLKADHNLHRGGVDICHLHFRPTKTLQPPGWQQTWVTTCWIFKQVFWLAHLLN